ncbi:signal peptidase I [Sinomonas sp. R1AF57]|uniref:signal peptidase I n=1 Tax=Sinomonas sp. R1AF57 TaxID=2020377 RepID=UPI000B601069|nr:signal peptidase I [Sinomonas sp. R1AF57]ASN52620.1 signal peptidase I [Sinomonas sp. R1AF57]
MIATHTAATVLRALVRLVLGLVLAVAAAAFVFLAVGPRFLGYQTSTMLTGSMAPLINPGDVVVSVETPASALKVGDIITYRIPVEDQRVETHRVASLSRNATGATVITTKGDANNGKDPWTAVITDDTVYTTAAVIPHLGDAIRALRSPVVRPVLLYGAPAVLLVIVLASIWRPRAAVEQEDGHATVGAEGRA